jgi:lysyl-tRNA synthetase class 2
MTNIVKNINAAQMLLKNYGKSSLSYFALHDKKRFFFSSTGNSFLAYSIEGKTVLVSGDPIGPSKDIPILLKEFNYFIKGAKLTSCFLAVNKETLENLVFMGHKKLNIGKEAIVTLSMFKKNLLKKKVRRAERHIINQGIICKIYKRIDIPQQYLNQLQKVADEWLVHKGGKEKRFTMTLGRIPNLIDPDCEIALALKNDQIIGYLTFVPYGSKSLSLDATRRKQNSSNGLIEFLLIQALEHFKKQGFSTISLNFATFHHTTKDTNKTFHAMLVTILYKCLSHIYKTNNLYYFNNKFMPDWQDRYVVFEKRRYLPNYLFAITKVEL